MTNMDISCHLDENMGSMVMVQGLRLMWLLCWVTNNASDE
jgi:hypothetical protein